MTAEHIFDELKRYVGFDAAMEERLRGLGGLLGGHFPRVAGIFYERIEQHDVAMSVFEDDAQIQRLKVSLKAWLADLFEGPWDHAYFERRLRIGRRHVEVDLPQHYMFAAMGVIRAELMSHLLREGDPAERQADVRALNAALDLELAVMLHSYAEDLQQRMRRKERLATFGLLTSTMGHELRNPLGVVESSTFLLRQRFGDDERAVRHLDRIHSQVTRANRIITSLLEIVRDREPKRDPAQPAGLIGAAVEAARVHSESPLQIELQVAEDLPTVEVQADQIEQLLLNLIQNAQDAAGPTGRILIQAERADAGVRILINDDGPGVDPEIRGRLFEPLTTTKPQGIGLGLALCAKIAQLHRGQLVLSEDGPLPGAAFTLTLPTH